MKKIILGGLICVIFIVTGCQSSKNNIVAPVVEAQEKTANSYNVEYDLNVESEENKVYVDLSIENKDSKTLPLYTENNNLFDVELVDDKEKVIGSASVKKGERIEILANEKVKWRVEFNTELTKELTVRTKLLLESKPYNEFNISERVQQASVYVWSSKTEKSNILFSPVEKKTYTYQTEDKQKYNEVFKLFNNNKVQSFSKEKGVTIYSEEDDGIYKFTAPDPVGDIDGTEFIEKDDMELLIPLPIEKGSSWNVGKTKYQLSDDDVKVKTKMGYFNHCVEITEIIGKDKKYYYYQEDIGLVKVKLARKLLPSKTVLELVKITDNN